MLGNLLRYLGVILLAVLLSGCGSQLPKLYNTKEHRLSEMIIAMDSSVDKNEAKKLAHEAIVYSRTLAHKYKVGTSPWIHNFLVNVGLKNRGLCYQWADDLLRHLSTQHSQSIKLLPIGANIGEYWSEHNAIVVLPSHHFIPLNQGIVLDAWRHSGDLYFVSIGDDTKYQWQTRLKRLKVVKQ
jgi:hypothetical protein